MWQRTSKRDRGNQRVVEHLLLRAASKSGDHTGRAQTDEILALFVTQIDAFGAKLDDVSGKCVKPAAAAVQLCKRAIVTNYTR